MSHDERTAARKAELRFGKALGELPRGELAPEQLAEFMDLIPEWSLDEHDGRPIFSKPVADIVGERRLPLDSDRTIGISEELVSGERRVVVATELPVSSADLSMLAATEKAVYRHYDAKGFSWQEYQILQRFPQTRQQLAEGIRISPGTVNVHLRSIYETLGVHSSAELVREGFERGLLLSPGLTEEEIGCLRRMPRRAWQVAELSELSYGETASRLELSLSSVQTYKDRAHKLTGATNQAELLYFVLRAKRSLPEQELEALIRCKPLPEVRTPVERVGGEQLSGRSLEAAQEIWRGEEGAAQALEISLGTYRTYLNEARVAVGVHSTRELFFKMVGDEILDVAAIETDGRWQPEVMDRRDLALIGDLNLPSEALREWYGTRYAKRLDYLAEAMGVENRYALWILAVQNGAVELPVPNEEEKTGA